LENSLNKYSTRTTYNDMIYKLTYTDKEQALADLKAKGILVEVEFNGEKHEAYGNGVQAVVEIGEILLIPPTYNENMEEITFPVYADGYHYDVMSDNTYDFGANLVEPKNPKHAFAGHATTEEFPYEPQFLGDEA
jgi:hypothetical protein